MVNVNDFIDSGEDMELREECAKKVVTVLETFDEICEDCDFEDGKDEEALVEILDNMYEQVYAMAYHEGFRDCVKENLLLQNDLLEALDDIECEENLNCLN